MATWVEKATQTVSDRSRRRALGVKKGDYLPLLRALQPLQLS
jgi:hypothetical protein